MNKATYTKKLSILEHRQKTAQRKELEVQNRLLIERKQLEREKKFFNDTLHEVRHISTQIKSTVENLYDKIDTGYLASNKEIENILKTLMANTSLLSIRMDAYDVLSNPMSLRSDLRANFKVYSKVEKVYKCLYAEKKAKNLEVRMLNNSSMTFKMSNLMELAFFIILENAFKYSYKGATVIIEFEELSEENGLDVKFINWGIRPDEDELKDLMSRGFRSKRAQNAGIRGSGLGLYILQMICDVNDVEIKIDIEDKNYYDNGLRYSPFILTLQFRN